MGAAQGGRKTPLTALRAKPQARHMGKSALQILRGMPRRIWSPKWRHETTSGMSLT